LFMPRVPSFFTPPCDLPRSLPSLGPKAPPRNPRPPSTKQKLATPPTPSASFLSFTVSFVASKEAVPLLQTLFPPCSSAPILSRVCAYSLPFRFLSCFSLSHPRHTIIVVFLTMHDHDPRRPYRLLGIFCGRRHLFFFVSHSVPAH